MQFLKFSSKISLLLVLLLLIILTISTSSGQNILCESCKQPITGDYWTVDGYIYCNKCFLAKAPRCSICDKLLVEEYVLNPYTGNKFCKTCYDKYPCCTSCGDCAGPGGRAIDLSIYLCPACQATAVLSYEKLSPVYQEAVLQLKSIGLTINKPVVNLTLMSQKELDSYTASSGINEQGFCETWSSGGFPYAHRIFILKGLTYRETLKVMCHELAHAWQFENNLSIQMPFISEGFAEWIAYKIMKKKGYDLEVDSMLNNQDPVYGDGLRYLLRYEAYYGTNKTLNFIKNYNK